MKLELLKQYKLTSKGLKKFVLENVKNGTLRGLVEKCFERGGVGVNDNCSRKRDRCEW